MLLNSFILQLDLNYNLHIFSQKLTVQYGTLKKTYTIDSFVVKLLNWFPELSEYYIELLKNHDFEIGIIIINFFEWIFYHLSITKYKFYYLLVPLRKSTVKDYMGIYFKFWDTNWGLGSLTNSYDYTPRVISNIWTHIPLSMFENVPEAKVSQIA